MRILVGLGQILSLLHSSLDVAFPDPFGTVAAAAGLISVDSSRLLVILELECLPEFGFYERWLTGATSDRFSMTYRRPVRYTVCIYDVPYREGCVYGMGSRSWTARFCHLHGASPARLRQKSVQALGQIRHRLQ